MTTLHLMMGLPCSGKTVYARTLAQQQDALVLTPDAWHVELFGQDALDPEHDRRHDAIERIMWDLAQQVLARGTDVILDFGFWSRSERDDFRARAAALGVGFRLHYMDVAPDELFRRLEERNRHLPPGVFEIPASQMARYLERLEAPGPDELT